MLYLVLESFKKKAWKYYVSSKYLSLSRLYLRLRQALLATRNLRIYFLHVSCISSVHLCYDFSESVCKIETEIFEGIIELPMSISGIRSCVYWMQIQEKLTLPKLHFLRAENTHYYFLFNGFIFSQHETSQQYKGDVTTMKRWRHNNKKVTSQ